MFTYVDFRIFCSFLLFRFFFSLPADLSGAQPCPCLRSDAWCATLVKFSSTCDIQAVPTNLQVPPRPGTSIPLTMLHSTCRRPWTISAPLRRRRTLAGGAQNIYINTGSARLLLVWPSILELSTDGTSTPGLDSRRLQAVVEDSFIFVDVGLWTFSPRAPMWRLR